MQKQMDLLRTQVTAATGSGKPLKAQEVRGALASAAEVTEAGVEDNKKKKKKKKRKKGGSRGSTTSTSSSSHSSDEFDNRSRFERLAEEKPGQLLLRAIGEIRRVISVGSVASPRPAILSPCFVAYYSQILEPQKGQVGLRSIREMKTLAVAIDLVLAGDATRALDILVQRFKALELAATDSAGWAAAQHMELVASDYAGTTGQAEKAEVYKAEVRARKLRERLMSKKGGGGAG